MYNDNDKSLVSIKEISKYFSVSERTVRNWVKEKKIPYVKIGGTYRFSIKEIREGGNDVPIVRNSGKES